MLALLTFEQYKMACSYWGEYTKFNPIPEDVYNRLVLTFTDEQIWEYTVALNSGKVSKEHENMVNNIDQNGTVSYNQAYVYCDSLGLTDWFRLYDGIDRVDMGELLHSIHG